jgi:hypothetical protein
LSIEAEKSNATMDQRRRLEISIVNWRVELRADVSWLEVIRTRPRLPRVGQNTGIGREVKGLKTILCWMAAGMLRLQ